MQLTNNFFNKCTCIDPNAMWLECGTACPDFCYKDDIQDRFQLQDCPRNCHAGCFCNSGFIKRTKDSSSSCIPITQCPAFFQSLKQQSNSTNLSLDTNDQENNFSRIDDESSGCFYFLL